MLVDWKGVVHASFVEKINDLNDMFGGSSEYYCGSGGSTTRGMAKKGSMNEASYVEIAKRLFMLVMIR